MSDEDRLKALEQRVTALETPRSGAPAPAPISEGDDTFWALEGLQARAAEPGAVMMIGSVQTPKGYQAQWQMSVGADELFASDFADRAESLSALAHPVRLRIVQRLMSDAETVQDLTHTGEFGTSGQIYHHLKQLTSNGWLRASGGGRYEVPVARVVPLLTILMGVDR